MQLKNKIYPYPVLGQDFNGYENSSFNTVVQHNFSKENITINIECDLNDEFLFSLLKNGDISYVHHIECTSTCYRKIIKSNEKSVTLTIKEQEVAFMLSVCTFLIPNIDLDKYENYNFNSDYKGFKFNIDKGCIIGVADQYNLYFDKSKDDFVNYSSIFSITPDMRLDSTSINVRKRVSKIEISLPQEQYNLYVFLQEQESTQSLMHSTVILPALMSIFSDMIRDGDALEEINGDFRWYRSLQNACKNAGYQLNSDTLKDVNILLLSQKLLNDPITNAITMLSKEGDTDET